MQQREKDFQLGPIIAVSLGHFFHDIFPAFLAPLLPLLIVRYRLSYALAGLLTVFLRGPSLINPLIGVLADRTSTRVLVIVSPAVTACLMSLLPAAPSYSVLIVMLLATGFSSSCFHVPAPVMIRHLSGSKIGTGMSVFMLGGELARSVGPIIILASLSVWGIHGTYRLIPLGLAASVFLYFRLRRDSVQRASTAPGRPGIFRELIRHRRLYLVVGGLFFSKNIVIAALTSFLPIYLTSRGSSLWLAGASLSILELAGAAGTFVSGSLSDRIGRRTMLLITSIATPLLMGVFILAEGLYLFPVLAVLGVFLFAVNPVLMAVVQENVSAYPSLANGMFMTLGFLTLSLCTFLIGILGDYFGLEVSYVICALLSVAGIPLALIIPVSPRTEFIGEGV